MNALEVVQRQFDAWNRHDARPLVALYAEGATYDSPCFDYPLTGQAIADFVKSVATAHPDLRFEIINSRDTGGGLVASQLVLHATHTDRFMDGFPLPVELSAIQWLASFRLRAIRSARSTCTLAGSRQLSGWGSKLRGKPLAGTRHCFLECHFRICATRQLPGVRSPHASSAPLVAKGHVLLASRSSETETRAQKAQQNVDFAASRGEALQNQLKESEVKAQAAQKDALCQAGHGDKKRNVLGGYDSGI